MKVIAQILLLLFITSLAIPAIVTIIKKDYPRSITLNLAEEEHKLKEVKVIACDQTQVNTDCILLQRLNKSGLILSKNLLKHDNVACSIFSPPPNLI